MYNKTGHHTESWDTPTPLGNCHHWCLTGNAWGHSWTRPLIICMRPEVDVRMRWECIVRYGATPRNPGIPTHAQTAQVSPRKEAWRHLRRRLGHSVQNRIRTWLKLRDRNIMKLTIRMSTYEKRNFNQVKYNTILHNIYIKMISES